MIRFGSWSTMLGLGALFALAVVAALLGRPAPAATALRLLAESGEQPLRAYGYCWRAFSRAR